MSLQLRISIGKWKFTTAVRQVAYWAAVLTLLLVLPQGHSQTVGTRTSLSVAKDEAKTTLTVTVKDPTGAAVSNGAVSFVSGGQSLGSAFVDENGKATLTLDQVPANAKQITAVYSGNEHYAASASASASIQADASTGLPDFSISASPTSLSLSPGDYGTSIITVTPINGFTQSVTMSISGLPTATPTTFTPNIVTLLSGTAGISTLQVQTTATTTSFMKQARPFGGNAAHLAYALLFPGAALALVGIGALRRRGSLRMMGVVLLVAASTTGMMGCSQRYDYLKHPPAVAPGTPAGSYNLTVTAYSNNGGEVTTHTLQIVLTVK
jgi:uncharacterized membrane protein